jgi:hypothetical protein
VNQRGFELQTSAPGRPRSIRLRAMRMMFHITLSDFDLWQAMDGLHARSASWENTAHNPRLATPPTSVHFRGGPQELD